MTFGKQLDAYMEAAGCTARELACVCGISEATLSRYRNDMRISKITARQIAEIASGLLTLSGDDSSLSYDEIYSVLMEKADVKIYDFPMILQNVNTLIHHLDINSADLAKSLNYDASYLSRIRSGQRKPADAVQFVTGISSYIIKKYSDHPFVNHILQQGDLFHWICNNAEAIPEPKEDFIGSFINMLDRFDLNEYLDAIHFNETHIPSLPFYAPANRHYYGFEEMRQGELDFFKSVMFSKKPKDIFMHNDMPIQDMAKDTTFDKKWMMAIAVILKRNFHINIIHDIDRPLSEMLLGLEAWLPLYMTGQVSSYYLKNTPAGMYRHLLYIHGNVALTGEGIAGFPENGKYYLTRNKEEVDYYQRRSDNILSKATPLMQVFRYENVEDYKHFLQQDRKMKGSRRNCYSVLPIYTLSRELFYRIGESNQLTENEISAIWQQIETIKIDFDSLVQENRITDEIPDLSTNGDRIPVSLAAVFCDRELVYTPEQYQEHLRLTKAYAKTRERYSLRIIPRATFKNIDIIIHEGKWAMISKKTVPAIHFLIKEKRLLHAIENFSAPVVEAE